MKMNLRDLRNLDRDDLLELIGLQRKSSWDWFVPTLGGLGVGLALGIGLGVLFAPKPGHELRDDLGRKFQAGMESIPTGSTGFEKPARTL